MSDHMTTDPATARVAAAKDVGRRLADCAICGASAPPTAWNRRPAVGEDVVREVADEIAKTLSVTTGGCFRPSGIEENDPRYGECADGNCYCVFVAKTAARAILDHLTQGE